MSKVNSKSKGKRGELHAVHFLRGLGFVDAQRSVQYNGLGKSDIVCPESAPRVHIEVKYGYDRNDFDLGSKLLCEACKQASRESDNLPWIVLWRPKGSSVWRGTFFGMERLLTVCGADVGAIVRVLNETQAS